MPETSLSLLEQLRQDGATADWRRLVDMYTPVLQNWLRRYEELSPADAEDLVQEVLLTLSRELPHFQHSQQPGAFRRWLRQILVHRLQNFWRSRQHQPHAVGGSDFQGHLQELADDASGISREWDRQHDQHVMRQLLEMIRPRFAPETWQAFHQQVIEGKAPEDVAEQLNLSVNSVYVAKSRVLQALRKASEGLVE